VNEERPDESRSHRRLDDAVEREVRRMVRAEKERDTVLAQTVFLGTLGLVFVLPVVCGAYLGRWLDEKTGGYSLRWTLSLLCVGLLIGAINVYFLFRESGDGNG
jgi:ATP synthase protein I